jgi:hypothetical protein
MTTSIPPAWRPWSRYPRSRAMTKSSSRSRSSEPFFNSENIPMVHQADAPRQIELPPACSHRRALVRRR